jgi:hypothetical protein
MKIVVIAVAILALAGCNRSLPGGYSVRHADRGKAWLQNPDGTLAAGGVIKNLYADNRRILVVAYASGDETGGPKPLDETCYVALLIDTSGGRAEQISMAEAGRQASTMSTVESYDRPCLRNA